MFIKECRFCFSSNIIKNGIVFGKQRYKCKDCKKNFREYKPKYDREITIKIIKSYLNGMGFRAIERVFNIPNTLVLYWIRKLGKKLEDLQNKEKIITDKDIIDILEADELFTFVGRKKNEVRVWTYVNRNSLKLIDFELGSSGKSTWLNIVFRLKERYKRIRYLATDGNPVYNYYKFTEKHIVTKAETSLVEFFNCRLRHYLARLKRKTLCYSKNIDMLRISINLLLNIEKVLSIIIYQVLLLGN